MRAATNSLLPASPLSRAQWRNCQLEHLKRKRGAWLEKQEANERKVKMFADVLGDDSGAAGTLLVLCFAEILLFLHVVVEANNQPQASSHRECVTP